jgi:DNA polymerase III sliding clamp (beta) subunit (PCNA family)
MNRKDFLNTLELVAPALAQDNMVPIFQNFCFKEGTVYAWRDNLGIIAPCPVTDEFAVHGKTLIDLIRASSAKELDITLTEENALLVSGRSKVKLPYSTSGDFLFEEPEKEKWDAILEIDHNLLRGLELCLVTSSVDNTMPAFMGVSFVGGLTGSHFYSCDGDAISQYSLAVNAKHVQYTMPNAFCEALLRIVDKTGHKFGHLYINGQWVVAEMANAYRIFGRIIENPEPMNFDKEMKRIIKKAPDYIDIPSTLAQALNRARVIGETENKATDVKFDGRKLILTTDTHMGVVRDVLAIAGNHPSLEAKVSAKLMSRAISITDEFAMQEDCTTYRHGDSFLLVMANLAE